MSKKTRLQEEELQQQQVAPEAATPAAPAEVEAAQPAPAAEPAPVEAPVEAPAEPASEPLVAEDTTAEAGTFTAPEPGMIPIWIHSEDVAAATAMKTGDAEAAGTAPDATVTEEQVNTSPVDTAAAPEAGAELAAAPEPMPESKESTEEKITEAKDPDNDEDHDQVDEAPEEADKYAQPAAPIHSGSDKQKKMTEAEDEEEGEEEEVDEEADAEEEDVCPECGKNPCECEAKEEEDVVAEDDEDDIDLDAELDKVFNFEAEINTDDKTEAVEQAVDIIKNATDFIDDIIDEDGEDLVKEEDIEDEDDDIELPAVDEDQAEEDVDEEDLDFDDDIAEVSDEEEDEEEDNEEEMTESAHKKVLHESETSELPEVLSDILFLLADDEYSTDEEVLDAVVAYVRTEVNKYDLTEDEEASLAKISMTEEDFNDYENEDADWFTDMDPVEEAQESKGNKIVEDYEAVKYPAGYTGEAEDNENLVKAYESSSAARRRAYSEFRKSMSTSNPRFKEALRATSRITKSDSSEDSWNSNRFEEKYEERSQLDFAAMLKNGFLG